MNRLQQSFWQLAGHFRSWVRQGPRRFHYYQQLRELLHWLKWLPHRLYREVYLLLQWFKWLPAPVYRGPQRLLHWLRWLPYRLRHAVNLLLHWLRWLPYRVRRWLYPLLHWLRWLPYRVRQAWYPVQHWLRWLPYRVRQGLEPLLHWLRWLPYRVRRRLYPVQHWLRWLPYHLRRGLYLLLQALWSKGWRAWHFLYWLPYRLRHGAAAATAAARAKPLPPAAEALRRRVESLSRLLARRNLQRVGSYLPVRHGKAGHLAAQVTELLPAQELPIAPPRLVGPLPPGWPQPWPPLRVPMGAVTAALWHDARFIGRSDAVLLARHCIVGDLWQRETERTWDEVWGYARFDSSKFRYFRRRKAEMAVPRALVVVGGPSVNWAHWTTEYLPKVALAERLEAFHDWPLVVDEELHPNMVESLRLVGRPREILKLPQGTLLRVQQALTIGSPGYSAYEYRYRPEDGPPGFLREHTVFSPAALDLVRRRAWAAAGAQPRRERRIYVTRPKGSMRAFVGGEEVERLFAGFGFELVDTGGMGAAEQVRLFAGASCIAGQSGAGLTNLVFAPPGCRVIVFAANSPHSIFHYFANMGAAVGHRVYYCYGESIYEPGGHPGHAGFTIEPDNARKVWQAVVEDEPDLAAVLEDAPDLAA